MSQENVDRMRQSLDAFDRRDRSAWLALRDEDCEVVASAVWPDADVVRGRDAAWEFYVGVVDSFEPRTYAEEVEFVDAGLDKVIVHQHHELRGRASGAEVDFDFSVVVSFRDGTIVREQWFSDRADALEAVGLRE
jgi:ketosteroid isomerase-like protein